MVIQASANTQKWREFLAITFLAVMATVFAVTVSSSVVVAHQHRAIENETPVAHCDKISRMTGERLALQGLERSSADWRRQTQVAFRACMDERIFGHLIAKP